MNDSQERARPACAGPRPGGDIAAPGSGGAARHPEAPGAGARAAGEGPEAAGTGGRPAGADTRFDALLTAAVDAIVLIDPKGIITRFNAAAERLFGYASAEVVGKNVKLLMPEPYRSAHDGYLQRFAETGEAHIIGIGREVTARRRDGSEFPIDLSVGEFRAPDEHGFVGILRDASARKRFEATQREADELRARLTHVARIGTLGEMVSGIAHELNQPLGAIVNYASAGRRLLAADARIPQEPDAPRETPGGPDPQAVPRAEAERMQALFEKIAAQGQRAGEVIRRLRALLKRDEEQRALFDANQLIREVIQLTEFELHQHGLRLVLHLQKHLPPVLVDGVQIQQVILNLIRNALDAITEAGCGDVIEIRSQRSGDAVEILVADSGPGISDATAAQLFQPFFTTKEHGLGLGLSICQSIVTAHEGSLRHRDNALGGTTFVLRLPLAEHAHQP